MSENIISEVSEHKKKEGGVLHESVLQKYCYVCERPTITSNIMDLGEIKVNMCTADYLNCEVDVLKARHGDLGALMRERAKSGFGRAKNWFKSVLSGE